jgi:integrase
MATAFWRADGRTGREVLVAKWRDASAPGGWRYQRRPNDRTKRQAEDYARDMERKAERLMKGLDTDDPAPVTFGELLDWWWERHGKHQRDDSKRLFRAFLDKHLESLRPFLLTRATAGAFADVLDTLLSRKEEAKELSPKSLNHIRGGVYRIFKCARDPKARLWAGENPVEWVKRRKVPKLRYETLRREEVRPVLDALPALKLGSPWRGAAAVCLYAGARPGEAMGLWKEDVDLETGTLIIRRSWTHPWPKDVDSRTVLVVPELKPYLIGAMELSKNHLVFPRADGEPFQPDTRRLLIDHLRRALRKAGLVVGYDHTCRRCKAKATRAGDAAAMFTWRHQDGEQRFCPTCGMKLWAEGVPRAVRFYDLRHTHATLLRKARVDLGTVQKALGHSSPEITAGTYDHSELEDDRAAIERALTFRPAAAPVPEPTPPTPAAPAGGDAGRSVRTTGAPRLTTTRAQSADRAPDDPEPGHVISGGYEPVRTVRAGARTPSRDSGPRGRRFKSCLPDSK